MLCWGRTALMLVAASLLIWGCNDDPESTGPAATKPQVAGFVRTSSGEPLPDAAIHVSQVLTQYELQSEREIIEQAPVVKSDELPGGRQTGEHSLDCNPTPSPLVIETTPGGHGGEDLPDEFYCVDLCTGQDLVIEIGPLYPNEFPLMSALGGCNHGAVGCNEVCTPASFVFDPAAWVYDPIRMCWSNTITVQGDGCACLVLMDILPMELTTFGAIALDRAVKLQWTTPAEVDLDHFNVYRDGELVFVISAANSTGGTAYECSDEHLVNCRTYSYELTAVQLSGQSDVWGTVEATPYAELGEVTETGLTANFPNPFDTQTGFFVDLLEEQIISVNAVDAEAHPIATLVNSALYGAGRHLLHFDATELKNGIYHIILTVDTLTEQITVLKNATDPDDLLASTPTTRTNATGHFEIPEAVIDQETALRDTCFNNTGSVITTGVRIIAVKEGYAPADTILSWSNDSEYEIELILQPLP